MSVTPSVGVANAVITEMGLDPFPEPHIRGKVQLWLDNPNMGQWPLTSDVLSASACVESLDMHNTSAEPLFIGTATLAHSVTMAPLRNSFFDINLESDPRGGSHPAWVERVKNDCNSGTNTLLGIHTIHVEAKVAILMAKKTFVVNLPGKFEREVSCPAAALGGSPAGHGVTSEDS